MAENASNTGDSSVGDYPEYWPDELHDAEYGHYNDSHHASVEITSATADYDIIRHGLDGVEGAFTWTCENGSMFYLWGEDVDDSLLSEIISEVREYEEMYADDGDYEYAEAAQRVRRWVKRASASPPGEQIIE